ncbi:hypothetical protein JF546_01800 [Nitratireductor aquimarinus]|uniref:hypothetical protein n=1 Tax=Nitratireductor aquimarinus TaxID=889300 RepID=UPI001A8EEAA2|nr:hypothetical protein [Nitratireductor aquimarinus]MBN8241742.1 hypothetical protein [Nitratireductor aquimarinus]MBY6130128.1 hypothetical protein [Nitratireductor aquimarinus]MCA1304256.1 hypothetical protein [Nitratireductor aquimarinus]
MSKLTDFERGYVIACANLMALHDNEVIAADVLRELGIHWSKIARAGLCDCDIDALRKLRGYNDNPVFVDERAAAIRALGGGEG